MLPNHNCKVQKIKYDGKNSSNIPLHRCWVSPQVCIQEELEQQTNVDARKMGCNLAHAIDGNTRESNLTNFIRCGVSEAAAA
jgi:hypothetical protein